MILYSRRLMNLNIGQACQIMGFTSPPVDKRTLKKRYIELAKKYHPDQSTPAASVERMISVTDAYKTLQKLLEDGRNGNASSYMRIQNNNNNNNNNNPDIEMKFEADSFVAPGSTLSMSGLKFPWQRGRTKSAQKQQEKQLNKTSSFYDYIKQTRSIEREAKFRAERVKLEMKSSEGSHGFTAEHFEEIYKMQERNAPWVARRQSFIQLLWKYYYKKFKGAPKRCWDSVRYILFGQ